MRIIIADDHAVILMGLRDLFARHGDIYRIVGEARSGVQLLTILAATPCDLVITDFSMPNPQESADGLALLDMLRDRFPHLPVIVFTMIHHPPLIRDMLSHGARGVVSKGDVTTALLMAIKVVNNGHTYLGSCLRANAIKVPSPKWDGLSAREMDVMRLVAQGITVTQIAERAQRSVKTVSQQKCDAMRKLELYDDRQLHDYALATGLLSPRTQNGSRPGRCSFATNRSQKI